MPEHVPIGYPLAKLDIDAENFVEALHGFDEIVGANIEQVQWPILYVRSHYFLGRLYERQGDMGRAREYCRRFHQYWEDGDLDRDWVEEAREKMRP